MSATTRETTGTTTRATSQEPAPETWQVADPDGPLLQIVRRVERARGLDMIADRIGPLANGLIAPPQVRDLLRGSWLGHAAHPPLTDLPLGAWMGAGLLDLLGGRQSRPAAELLVGVGLAAAAPTVVTGLAEWATTRGGQRRVGLVHAVSNLIGGGCYAASLIARRRDRYALGVVLGLAGGAAASVGGYLGGHLAIGQKVGTGDPEVRV